MIAFTNIEYTIQLSEGLSNFVELILLIPEEQKNRFNGVINENVKIETFTLPRLRQIRNLFFIYKIAKKINSINPDILHIQRGHPWFNFILPFLRKCRIVTTIHDVIAHTGDKESNKVPAFTHKIAIKYANQIIVHGNKLKEEMISISKKDDSDINVLKRGINSIYNRYAIKNGDENNNRTVLFFGRIFEYKGLRYLIEAEPRISKEIPDVKIIIAGRGESFKENYGKYVVNHKNFIIYNEHISNEMVNKLFTQATVVALPYIDASQSGVVPLAYSFNKPVVVTNVGSLPEVVIDGETGFIVPPKNSQKLADAIIEILKNKKLRQLMSKNAGNIARDELSWEKIAKNTIEVYKKALSTK